MEQAWLDMAYWQQYYLSEWRWVLYVRAALPGALALGALIAAGAAWLTLRWHEWAKKRNRKAG